MPKTILLPSDGTHAGIDITWTKSTRRLVIGGWYDSHVGIPNTNLTLREFFDQLGITEKDCEKAFRDKEKE